jgi:hypothetical protein
MKPTRLQLALAIAAIGLSAQTSTALAEKGD